MLHRRSRPHLGTLCFQLLPRTICKLDIFNFFDNDHQSSGLLIKSQPRMNRASSAHSASFGLRDLLTSTLPVLLSLSTPFMAWKGLSILTASPYPVMCVISESMAPAFHRGDLLILWNRPPCIQVGDIPVVWFTGNPHPMVHRAVQVYNIDCEQDDASLR